MKETDLMHLIQAELCRDPAVRLWRNNVGNGFVGTDVTAHWQPVIEAAMHRSGVHYPVVVLRNFRRIKFGLGAGTSDLIGLRSIEITPEMVGKRVAVFVAQEVKMPRGRSTAQQATFVHVVNSLGGFAGVVRSVDEAREVLTSFSA